MKQNKVRLVLFLSLLALLLTAVASFFLESRSQKLPAVVNSDKVIVSSEADGVLRSYAVSSMQKVEKGALIGTVDNSKLPFKLQTLKKEKQKYDDLIASAKSGDFLNTELYELDEEIEKNKAELESARQDLKRVKTNLDIMQGRYEAARQTYEANKKLFDKGILNTSDFEKASQNFWDVQNDYSELQRDSLVSAESVKSSQNIIQLLEARKKILSGNADLLASKSLIDINSVEADINDLEEEIKSMNIYAPVSGVVTDINYLPGEKVAKGDILAEIADLSHVWVIAYGTSSSRHKVKVGQKVRIYSNNGKKINGKVVTVSPVMEKVKSLSSSFETINTYIKIEISFDDMAAAMQSVTPGERLFVRIFF